MNSDPPATPTVRSAADAAALLAPVVEREGADPVAVLHLDQAGRLLAIETYRMAGDGADLPVRDIMAGALRLDAAKLIVSRRRGAEGQAPSEDDIRATRAIASAGRSLGLVLADYLIFADGDCRSLRELGLL